MVDTRIAAPLRRGLLAVAVAMSLLAGCSGPADEAPDEDIRGGASPPAPAEIEPEALRTWLDDADDAIERALAAALATCMEDAGFPDVIVLADDAGPTADAPRPIAALDDDPGMAIGYATLARPLDEAEARAMFGDPGDEGGPFGPGCIGASLESVAGSAEAWERLDTLLDELETALTTDPRVVAATADWSGCMADAGHPGLTSPDDVADDLWTRAQALLRDPGPPDEELPGEPDGSEPDDDENVPHPGVGPPATEEELAQRRSDLEELKSEEDLMLAATLTCSEEHLVAVRDEVEIELLNALARDHADVLVAAGFRP